MRRDSIVLSVIVIISSISQGLLSEISPSNRGAVTLHFPSCNQYVPKRGELRAVVLRSRNRLSNFFYSYEREQELLRSGIEKQMAQGYARVCGALKKSYSVFVRAELMSLKEAETWCKDHDGRLLSLDQLANICVGYEIDIRVDRSGRPHLSYVNEALKNPVATALIKSLPGKGESPVWLLPDTIKSLGRFEVERPDSRAHFNQPPERRRSLYNPPPIAKSDYETTIYFLRTEAENVRLGIGGENLGLDGRDATTTPYEQVNGLKGYGLCVKEK